MRLDKLLGNTGYLSRKEATDAIRAGRVTVGGLVVKRADTQVREGTDEITLDGAPVLYAKYDYVWLNKPAGYVSATEDSTLPCVTELLPPPYDKRALFPCGRLDRDTVGWMLLTNDGQTAHRLLSPKRHVEKIYRFQCDAPLPREAEERFATGMAIDGGEVCKNSRLVCNESRTGGEITLTEGKYHQVKRMIEALGSRVTFLECISFAGIPLDPALARGQWRPATEEEKNRLLAAAEIKEN